MSNNSASLLNKKTAGLSLRSCRLRFSSALFRAGCRDFLTADDNVTDFQRVSP